MASTPRMDLNQYWNYSSIYDNATDFDRPVMTTYEPGSALKVITMASALELGRCQARNNLRRSRGH